jgi:hypothetical protein
VYNKDERKKYEFCNTLSVTGVGRQVLKRIVKRQQNPTLIVGREGKYENMKLFPAVS